MGKSAAMLMAGCVAAAAIAGPVPRAGHMAAKTAAIEVSYDRPAAVARYPALAALLDRKWEALRREAAVNAEADRRDAVAARRPFNRHAFDVAWTVVTQTPRFLSLSADIWAFWNGAHGLPTSDALVWDKATGVVRKPIELFDRAALQRAVGAALCRAVDAEREERRGAPVVRSAGDPFTLCPKAADATILLGSTDRRAIERLGFVFDPYGVGPYSESTYEITLPVTRGIVTAVKPEFRDAFRAR